ncbi:hypothetical protein BH23CHL2_BH23CHL2_12740 [soil metagenome]
MDYLRRPLSPAMWSRALFMWGVLALVALLLGVAALWMGNFIQDNIKDELEAQQISFPPEEAMSDQEREIDGLTAYAGEQLSTGDQAKVYSEYILLHMNQSAEEAGHPGATYATLGGVQRGLRADVQAAQDAGDEQALEEAEAELAEVTALRNTMLTGSNLRGNLLSAYGWGNVGQGVFFLGIGIIVLAIIFTLLFFFEWRRGHLPEGETHAERSYPAGTAESAA